MLKPELQAKFIQYLNNRKNKNEEGFTLIELLVVVIIIGVLAAIALPSLLGQINKAKQSEARNYVGTVNRAQQAYFLEYQKFAEDLQKLQVGIKTQSDNFYYSVITTTAELGIIYGSAYKPALKSYYGVVGTITGDTVTKESLTVAVACESSDPSKVDSYAKIKDIVDDSKLSATGCDEPKFKSLAK